MRFVTHLLSALLHICFCSSFGLGFVLPHSAVPTAQHFMTQNDDAADSEQVTTSSSSSVATTATDTAVLFPVINRIAGTEFTGSCRYINSKLQHVTNLKLFGGVKYEIIDNTQLKLSSFLTFPNGQTRQVVMQGGRNVVNNNGDDEKDSSNVMTLYPIEDGPIIMKVSEIVPDTILINEVERESGKIIMTSSISIVQSMRGLELVGVSHEVGDVAAADDDKGDATAIEGPQIWRMRGPMQEKVVLSREFE